jgi:hypothetical protein
VGPLLAAGERLVLSLPLLATGLLSSDGAIRHHRLTLLALRLVMLLMLVAWLTLLSRLSSVLTTTVLAALLAVVTIAMTVRAIVPLLSLPLSLCLTALRRDTGEARLCGAVGTRGRFFAWSGGLASDRLTGRRGGGRGRRRWLNGARRRRTLDHRSSGGFFRLLGAGGAALRLGGRGLHDGGGRFGLGLRRALARGLLRSLRFFDGGARGRGLCGALLLRSLFSRHECFLCLHASS